LLQFKITVLHFSILKYIYSSGAKLNFQHHYSSLFRNHF